MWLIWHHPKSGRAKRMLKICHHVSPGLRSQTRIQFKKKKKMLNHSTKWQQNQTKVGAWMPLPRKPASFLTLESFLHWNGKASRQRYRVRGYNSKWLFSHSLSPPLLLSFPTLTPLFSCSAFGHSHFYSHLFLHFFHFLSSFFLWSFFNTILFFSAFSSLKILPYKFILEI